MRHTQIHDCDLYEANCLDLMASMADKSVDLVVTSPPYWNQRAYSHWPTYADYMADVKLWVTGVARVLKPGRHCFWVIPDKLPWPPKENGTGERLYMPIYADTERIAAEAGLVCKFPIVWLKYQAAQRMFGSYPYPPTIIHTPMTERICVWRKPGKPDLTQKSKESRISLDDWKLLSKDVWQFRAPDNKIHPGEYPVELPRNCIKLWSFVNDLIFDPFMGSATTALACAELGRRFIGSELSTEYYDMARKRVKSYYDNQFEPLF